MADGQQGGGRSRLVAGCVLLAVASLPDAMVVPVLHGLSVDRFGVGEGAAHAFMAVNLLGAVGVVLLLAILKRRSPPSQLLPIAAVVSMILLALMSVAPSWPVMLALRCIEGGADLILLAIPLRMISLAGGESQYGARMGVAFTVLMVALACGAMLGAIVGSASAGSVLLAGSVTSGVLFVLACWLRRFVRATPRSPDDEPTRCPLIPSEWFGALMLAMDRGLAALVSVTLPILLASGFDIGPVTLGMALGGMFMALAVFAIPVGRLADAMGGGRVRVAATAVCSTGIAGLGLLAWFPAIVVLPPCLLVYGAGAAGLMPSAFTSSVRQNASTLVFSSLQAAGQLGYAVGIGLGAAVVAAAALPPQEILPRIFPIAAIAFLVANLATVAGLQAMSRRVQGA